MTLFDASEYESTPTKKPRKETQPATCTIRESDGTWFAITRRSGMVQFAHRLGREANKYGSVTTRCGTMGRIVEHFARGTTVNACDSCQRLGVLTRLSEVG